MSVITQSRTLARLSRKLQRAGLDYWIGQSSGDKWGKYLVFKVGGVCIGGAGWTLAEAARKVDHLIRWKDVPDAPPFEG